MDILKSNPLKISKNTFKRLGYNKKKQEHSYWQ